MLVQLVLRLATRIGDTRVLVEQLLRLRHVFRDRLFRAAVPVVERGRARLFRQEIQEVELAADAQEIHIQAREELQADVAVNVVTGDQQIVNPFEQWIVDDPGGLGLVADEPFHHGGAIEMAKHRQCGALIDAASVPDHVQGRVAALRMGRRILRGFCRHVFLFVLRVVVPVQQPQITAAFG